MGRGSLLEHYKNYDDDDDVVTKILQLCGTNNGFYGDGDNLYFQYLTMKLHDFFFFALGQKESPSLLFFPPSTLDLQQKQACPFKL